jgi:hypothetical protein
MGVNYTAAGKSGSDLARQTCAAWSVAKRSMRNGEWRSDMREATNARERERTRGDTDEAWGGGGRRDGEAAFTKTRAG